MKKGGAYWDPIVRDKVGTILGPSMRVIGATKHIDLSYNRMLDGRHDKMFDEMLIAFRKVVPRGLWWLAGEHEYGGVKMRALADGCAYATAVSLTSLEFGYMAARLASLLLPAGREVLEIGAGFGGLARVLLMLDPTMRLTIVDFEPMLRIQRHYLEHTGVDVDRVRFSEEIPVGGYSLAINTKGFCEMDLSEVNAYFGQLSVRLAVGSFFYSINHNRCKNDFSAWEVPKSWLPVDLRLYPLPWKKGEQFFWWERTWRIA